MTTHPTRRLARFATLLALGLATCATLPVTARAAEDDETMAKSDAPATKPSAAAPAGRRGADFRRGGDGPFQRLRENADKLGLTADQKKEIERIAADAREKSRQVFADAKGDRDKVRQDMGEVFRDAMQQMREILTPDQQRKVRDLLEQGPGMRWAAAAAGGSDDETMMADGRAGTTGKADKKRPAAAKEAAAAPKVAVDPATVEFNRLDGKAVPISTYKGKPLVLVFGSYSCPSFREHAKAIDELQRRYATKANFLLVYTREAHPVGGWEVQRNKDAEINVQPHKDEAARLAAAKQARGTLGLSIPMAVDSMDDQLATAFDAFPNGCVILDREGKVAARQKWAEVRGIRAALDEISSAKPTTAQAVTE